MKKLLTGAIALLLLLPAGYAQTDATTRAEPNSANRKIQVALLLDISGSMSGLIDQARTQLWTMVQLLGKARCIDQRPRIEIALYAYGGDGPDSTFIRQVMPFTTNLDSLSEALFLLTTSGSEEYCGLALHKAATELLWDKNPGSYRAIFISGNESFFQGPFKPSNACKEALGKGIIINTIFCGGGVGDVTAEWSLQCGTGRTYTINANIEIDEPPTPYDSALYVWNDKFNATLLPYRARADTTPVADLNDPSKIMKYVVTVDSLNFSAGAAAGLNRVATKGNQNLNTHPEWDLVDAERATAGFARRLDRSNLPLNLRDTSIDALEALIRTKSDARDAARSNIRSLTQQRAQWLLAHKANSSGNDETLQTALGRLLTEQLQANGFSLD
ncbi:MAG: VWA domain-containing protein [Chitinophagaceae bacterium]|nr:MAG: VWA domain-containing protein [Chitinophagaceae bacterium]